MSGDAVSAAPEALRSSASAGLALDDELAAFVRSRLAPALRAWSSAAGSTACLGLDDNVAALASEWAGLDRWVGRVGMAFAAADAGGLAGADASVGAGPAWFDQLSDEDALADARRWAALLTPAFVRALPATAREELRAQLFPLWSRLRARYPEAVITAPCASVPAKPDGLEDVLAALRVPDPPPLRKVNPLVGFLDGLVLGRADEHGFDNLSGELARLAGHLTSGFFAVGNARDLVADLARGHAGQALLDAAFLVPGLGDAGEAGRTVVEAGEEIEIAGRAGEEALAARQAVTEGLARSTLEHPAQSIEGFSLSDHDAAGGHIQDHVGQTVEELRARLAQEGAAISASSSFPDETTAASAVADALRANQKYVERVTSGNKPKTVFRYDVGREVGIVVPHVGPPAETTWIEVVLRKDPTMPDGFRVQSAFPVR